MTIPKEIQCYAESLAKKQTKGFDCDIEAGWVTYAFLEGIAAVYSDEKLKAGIRAGVFEEALLMANARRKLHHNTLSDSLKLRIEDERRKIHYKNDDSKGNSTE